MPPPVGPEVDTTPRPLPARVTIRGQHVVLEPLHIRHAPELWHAAQGADESWTYLGMGPFASAEAMRRQVADMASMQDYLYWAVRPVATGVVSGWLALLDIQPKHAAIELGGIWFSPRMQRTKASTETIYLLLKLAADDLDLRLRMSSLHSDSGAMLNEGVLSVDVSTTADCVTDCQLC